MSFGWSLFVITLIVLNIVGCIWLLVVNRSVQIDPNQTDDSTGHEYDGITELNNPLPAWWTWLFVVTIVFGAIYWILYPGFGDFEGVLGWTSVGQYEGEVEVANERFGPIFEAYYQTPIVELVGDEPAVEMGGRIFGNRCSTCHGSDARGGPGYPNLTDRDWIHGGAPENIVHTITNGRNGMMPAFAAVIGGDEGVAEVTEYVLSLSGRDHDQSLATKGATQFAMVCSACHQTNGKGNPMMGAPNLTDDTWLHGGRRGDIVRALNVGLVSQMPAHEKILTPEQIHLVALYVYSRSNSDRAGGNE